MNTKRSLGGIGLLALLAACSSNTGAITKTDDQYKADVTTGMHDSIVGDIDALVKASEDLQAAAPTPAGRGWDKTQDAAAITAMKAAWMSARTAYEHIEGALAPIFPDVDASIDARYDDFLTDLGPDGDESPFDDSGVTGLHAAERILYLDSTPENVVTFEASLPGYHAAAYPATEAEAADFKNKLLAKIVADAKVFQAQWTPAQIDIASAYAGLIGLMNEQKEKVNKASEGAEESRYSQQTMRDVRYNLEGTKKIYTVFAPWITAKAGGSDLDKQILAGMDKLNALYTAVQGDAIPTPPATWSAEAPSAADLQTPFGTLYSGVKGASDAADQTSVVSAMNNAADLLGFARFKEE